MSSEKDTLAPPAPNGGENTKGAREARGYKLGEVAMGSHHTPTAVP